MVVLEDVLNLAVAADATGIRSLIAPSLPAVRRGLAERGRSCPIELRARNSATTPSVQSVIGLVRLRRLGALDSVEFFYVATALDLHLHAHELADNALGDIVADLAEVELSDSDLQSAEKRLFALAG